MRPIGGELVTTITSPSCWGTHFLYISNPPSGNLLPIIPWLCVFLIPVCPNQILITMTFNSKSINKFITSISRHYRAKFHKLRGPTNSIEKMSFGDDEMFKDQNDLNDQNDEHNNRYSNSSTSGEFENVFPYREQIDHLLSATTRQIRKSRKETKILFAAANLSWFPQHSSDMGKLMCA